MDKYLAGITHTTDLLDILKNNGVKEIALENISEPGVYFLIPKSLRRGISVFIGYKWGDFNQDDKVEKYGEEYSFYALPAENTQNKSFESFIIDYLDSLKIKTSKKESPVHGPAPLLEFSKYNDRSEVNAFAQFEVNCDELPRNADDGAYYLAYMYGE